MSEMVERVARAMCPPDQWEGENPYTREMYVTLAEKAIEAMRTPTPEMIAAVAPEAGSAEFSDYELAGLAVDLLPPTQHPDVADVLAGLVKDYRGMIDAALQ